MPANTVKTGRAELPSLAPRARAVSPESPSSRTIARPACTISSLENFAFGGIFSPFRLIFHGLEQKPGPFFGKGAAAPLKGGLTAAPSCSVTLRHFSALFKTFVLQRLFYYSTELLCCSVFDLLKPPNGVFFKEGVTRRSCSINPLDRLLANSIRNGSFKRRSEFRSAV